MKPHDREDDDRSTARGFGEGYAYVGAGLSMAFAMLLFGAGGWVIDGWLHTRPLFAIVGGLLGGFAGFMNIYTRVTRDAEREKRERGAGTREPGAGSREP